MTYAETTVRKVKAGTVAYSLLKLSETEKYYPKLLKAIKATTEYDDAARMLQYQIESMLDIYKRLM